MHSETGVAVTALRHRWEMPLVWIAAGLSLAAVLLAIGLQFGTGQAVLQTLDEDTRTVVEDFAGYGGLVLLAPVLIFVFRYFMATKARANSVKAGPAQFPELWAMYLNLAEKLGIEHLPRLYVTMGNGVVNAYALSCNTRSKYVVIHAEIAHLIHSHPKIVEFVLAHELAHHKLGHVSLWRNVITMIPNVLVLPGKAVTRAQEYSADRLAFHHCPDCIEGCSFLGVGPFMAGQVNEAALHEQAIEDDKSLWVRLHNIMSDHAVLVKRFKALKDMEREGIRRHGQMF